MNARSGEESGPPFFRRIWESFVKYEVPCPPNDFLVVGEGYSVSVSVGTRDRGNPEIRDHAWLEMRDPADEECIDVTILVIGNRC